MTGGPSMALDFTRAKPSTIVHVLKFAATTRRRGRIITALVTRFCPLAIAVLAGLMALAPSIDGLYSWTSPVVVHVAFWAAAAFAVLRAAVPSSGMLANLSMIVAGWPFLGRTWFVWAEADDLSGWSRAVGGAAYAVIVLLMLTVHLLHVALLLADRAEQLGEAGGGGLG